VHPGCYYEKIEAGPRSQVIRWQAGYADTMRVLRRRPWDAPIDPMMGVAVHDSEAPDAGNP